MITALASIGAFVVLGYLVFMFAQAIRTSGLEEFSLTLRFQQHEETPKTPKLAGFLKNRFIFKK